MNMIRLGDYLDVRTCTPREVSRNDATPDTAELVSRGILIATALSGETAQVVKSETAERGESTMNLNRVIHVGSFKSHRELDGPKQLRQCVAMATDAIPSHDVHVTVSQMTAFGRKRRIVKISTPYEVQFIAAFPIA